MRMIGHFRSRSYLCGLLNIIGLQDASFSFLNRGGFASLDVKRLTVSPAHSAKVSGTRGRRTHQLGGRFNLVPLVPRRRSMTSPILFRCTSSLTDLRSAGNTTCASNQLSWYTSVVGESPCMTYQRLRQICNNDYQVPTFSSSKPPGDRCDDQLSSCCCNSIAFHLSMLCMVCQLDTRDSGGPGIDAPSGTYNAFLKGCSPVSNNTLPSSIQSAVCNENIRLDNFLYSLHWWAGDWYYVFSEETAESDHAKNKNNTFTHCANQASPTQTSTVVLATSSSHATPNTTSNIAPNTSSADNTQSKSKSDAPLIGGVVGGLLGLALIVLVVAVVIWRRRKNSRQALGGISNRLATEGSPTAQASHGASGVSENASNPSQSAVTSTETSFRHYDAGPLMWGPTRPNLGSLPPAYDHSWDSDPARATPNPSPGFVSTPSFDSGSPAPRVREGKRGMAAFRSPNQR